MNEFELGKKNPSVDDINNSKALLKFVINTYSSNVKNFAKWFEISQIDKKEGSYTSYKIIYRFLPKDLNESIKELSVWKRFRDFKDLYLVMSNYHMSLHRKDKFPEFVKTKFFGRFDDKVIEERKEFFLRLLQFIGSQSHLYKHERFIEFFLDAKFIDYSHTNDSQILEPKSIDKEVDRSKQESNKNKKFKSLQSIYDSITELMEIEKSYLSKPSSRILMNHLNQIKNCINIVITKLDDEDNKMAYDLIKSACDTLSDCLEQSEFKSSKRPTFINTLHEIIDNLNSSAQKLLSPIDSNQLNKNIELESLNDWVFGEFNLQSRDFNNELSVLAGNLFDLNFGYKITKILNHNCSLVRNRHEAYASNDAANSSNQEFILKRLQKSSNPPLQNKSIVPFGNRVPFMCQLLKYFESDNTIFLLIEYHQHGKLFSYLEFLLETGDLFLKNLNQFKKLKKQVSVNRSSQGGTTRRRSSMPGLKMNYSSSCISYSHRKLRAQSSADSAQFFSEQKTSNFLRELQLDRIKYIDDNSNNNNDSVLSLSSSNSSNSSTDTINEASQNKNKDSSDDSRKLFKIGEPKSSSILSESNKIDLRNDPSDDSVFSNTNEHSNNTNFSVNENKMLDNYFNQVKIWLAQLYIAIKSLHDIGMICKDLRPDNLLLSSSGQLVLTYMSRWNLVDEKISKDSVKNFYVAPELSGLVNLIVSESCDWWTYGIIAYEFLTMKKFTDMHSNCDIYVNNIAFPEDFNNEVAKDFITKILKLNPTDRLSDSDIRSHKFFSSIDWDLIRDSNNIKQNV